MDESFEKRLINYRLMMCLASEMQSKGIITSSDHERIREILSEKYGVSGSIYC